MPIRSLTLAEEKDTDAAPSLMPTTERPEANASRPSQVEIVDFGNCGRVLLLAEYDAESDTIRVNARAVEWVQSIAGTAEAEAFVACAVAHERFHRDYPNASEAGAHEHVRAVTGDDPRRFEAYVRGTPLGPS